MPPAQLLIFYPFLPPTSNLRPLSAEGPASNLKRSAPPPAEGQCLFPASEVVQISVLFEGSV